MKKFYTKLLVVSIICTILVFLLCLITLFINGFDFLATEQAVDELNSAVRDTTGGGEYLLYFLIKGGFSLMADFTVGLAYLFTTLIIPSFILLAIILSQIIARLFQIKSEKKWKTITSKIFTYLSLILQFLLFYRLFVILSIPNINTIATYIALFVNIFCIIFFIYTLIKLKKFETQNS